MFLIQASVHLCHIWQLREWQSTALELIILSSILSVVTVLFDVVPHHCWWDRKQATNAVNIIACAPVYLQVSPSVYTQEMLKSTEERLANINEVHPPRILELLDMGKTTHHKVNAS